MRNVPFRRPARALAAVVLILAAVLLGAPGSASAHGGRGRACVRSRVGYHATWYRPSYRYRSYRTYAYRPYYRSVAYRPYYRTYAYRPYDDDEYAPVYRDVYVDDCDDDYVTYVRPVYRHHVRHRPRVAVSLSFGSPGYFVGDPYCGW